MRSGGGLEGRVGSLSGASRSHASTQATTHAERLLYPLKVRPPQVLHVDADDADRNGGSTYPLGLHAHGSVHESTFPASAFAKDQVCLPAAVSTGDDDLP